MRDDVSDGDAADVGKDGVRAEDDARSNRRIVRTTRDVLDENFAASFDDRAQLDPADGAVGDGDGFASAVAENACIDRLTWHIEVVEKEIRSC
jgi:hypothetical protein